MNKFIILGASNVSLSLPLIFKILSESSNSPVGIFIAAGHGRSYCSASRVMVRTLPSLTSCGLWSCVKSFTVDTEKPDALISDIGNDLLYGFSPDRILQEIRICIERLLDQNAEIRLTLLPLKRLQRLSPLQYHFARSILFPGRKQESLKNMFEKVTALQNGLISLAETYQVKTISPDPKWYGLDPIHIRRSARLDAWNEILNLQQAFENRPDFRRPKLLDRVKMQALRAEKRKILFFNQYTEQPVFESDGRIKLFLF